MNKINKLLLTLFFIVLGFGGSNSYGQATGGSHKRTGQNHQAFTDSLKNVPYPYHLPIFGTKVRKLGFDIPFPNGLMVNFITSKQEVLIDSLKIGFDEDPSTWKNVDRIVALESVLPSVNLVNLRYDFWLFPFLNFYALGGYVDSKTEVNMSEPFIAQFNAKGKGPMVGWGTVLAGGVGPVIFSGDFNMAWTFLPQLDNPALALAADIRLGHMFVFKNKPDMNIVATVGGQYLRLNKDTRGRVDLAKVAGITDEDKMNAQNDLDDWYNGLGPIDKNIFEDLYNGISGWLSNTDPRLLHYSFNKSLPKPWSMTLGLNYQIDKRYQLTSIYAFLGSREQFVLGVNYRFGWKGHNWFSGSN